MTTESHFTDKSSSPNFQTAGNAKQLSKGLSVEYVVSWKWLASGVCAFLVLGVAAFATHSVQTQRLADHVIEIVDRKVENDRLSEAASILSQFKDARPSDLKLSDKLTELLDKMYESLPTDPTLNPSSLIRQYRNNLRNTSQEQGKSLREKILELENRRGNLAEILVGAREIIRMYPSDPNPLAWRLLSLAILSVASDTGIFTTRPPEPQFLDILLENTYNINKGDVTFSLAYADFLRSVNPYLISHTSDVYQAVPLGDRQSKADAVIEEMISLNPNESNAFVARYFYRDRNRLTNPEVFEDDPDLAKALLLNPSNTEALVRLGEFEFRQAMSARRKNDFAAEETLREKAVSRFRAASDLNKMNELPHQFLGEIYETQNNIASAIKEWATGNEILEKTRRPNQTLRPRLVRAYIQTNDFANAEKTLDEFNDYLLAHVDTNRSIQNRQTRTAMLLRGLLYAQRSEGEDAANALQIFNNAFAGFDTDVSEYLIDNSAYSLVVGDAFMAQGDLYMKSGYKYDQAAQAFANAMRYPRHRERALANAVFAWQQAGIPEKGVDLLKNEARQNPNNQGLQFMYANLLFQEESKKSFKNWRTVESEIQKLIANKNQLAQPWRADLLEIRYNYEKSGTGFLSQQNTLSQLRALSQKTPVSAPFLAELASLYSALASPEDMESALLQLKELPGGSAAYFNAKINDAIRRNDIESATSYCDEALEVIPNVEKMRFLAMKETLQRPNASPDERYKEMQQTVGDYLSSPENTLILNPATLFTFAEMALDRGDLDVAKSVEERLAALEGESGTLWRYCKARRLIANTKLFTDPIFVDAKAILDYLVAKRPDWPKTYLLSALIETKFGATENVIKAYRQAVSKGTRQPEVFAALIDLLEKQGDLTEANEIRSIARQNRISLDGNLSLGAFQGHYDQIRAAIDAGDLNLADQLADRCIQFAKDNNSEQEKIYDLQKTIGKLFLDFGFPENAIKHLEAVAVQGGKNVYPLAVALAKAGRIDDAFTRLLDEAKKSPNDGDTLSPILVLLSQVKPSEEIYSKIDELMSNVGNILSERKNTMPQSDFVTAVFPLADYWTVRRNPDNAIPLYQAALEKEPNNLLATNNLALLYGVGKKDTAKGLELIDKALRQEPNQPSLLDSKGLIYLAAGQPEQAAPLMEQACELSCRGPLFVMHYAFALLTSGDNTNAKGQFDAVSNALKPDRMLGEDVEMFNELSQKLSL